MTVVAVVGGGPAGLIAAERLAIAGHSVTIYEHRASVGRKFLLAGRGGLNLTHTEPIGAFLDRYGVARPVLASAVGRFGPSELRSWAADLGEETFVGSSGRVFPKSFRATPLLRAWLRRLETLGVTIALGHRWLGWSVDGSAHHFAGPGGDKFEAVADATVLAFGGASWPRVGSDGAWVDAVRARGVEASELQPANCGLRVTWSDDVADRFAGTPLKNVAVSFDGVTIRGDAVVTKAGIEGGPVYAHSAAVRRALKGPGSASLLIDLHPDLTAERLEDRLRTRRRPKDALSTTLRRVGLDAPKVAVLRESMALTSAATGADERIPADIEPLAALIKAVPLPVADLMPIDRAISSAGGVPFSEVDDRFMLRRVPGTFVAGEMLDWEAPTGGYLLQACFSTGVAAAAGVSDWLASAD